jgi:hypothetical protein
MGNLLCPPPKPDSDIKKPLLSTENHIGRYSKSHSSWKAHSDESGRENDTQILAGNLG